MSSEAGLLSSLCWNTGYVRMACSVLPLVTPIALGSNNIYSGKKSGVVSVKNGGVLTCYQIKSFLLRR
jgi:hypothetical protein